MVTTHAPIALFVYYRPEHTLRTLQALSRNSLASESRLIIFADGPKPDAGDDELRRLLAVRKLIREKSWCGEVESVESDTNKGLADSIRGGIDRVLVEHDRVIVLEDDLETSPGFLSYMNSALEVYKNENRVFQISGFMVKNRPWSSTTGFLRVSTSWGWATWQRAWRYYRDDTDNLLIEVLRKDMSRFDLDGHSFHCDELERNVKGDLKTWAVRWYASLFIQDGLCLYPKKSLVRNLGFDGSGVNCHDDETRFYQKLNLASAISVRKQIVAENEQYLRAMQLHYDRLLQRWTRTRLRDRLINKIRSLGVVNS